jgi:lipoprotein-releasing system permease protein
MQTEWDIISNNNLLDNIMLFYKNDNENLYESYSIFKNGHIKTDSIELTSDQLIVNGHKQPIFLYSYYLDLNKEKYIVTAIQDLLGSGFLVQNKYQQNADLYKIMQIEKWIIFAILALIMVVASFNLVGALTMLVLEKQKDIHVLHAMGATAGTIQKIFLSLSIVMAMTGALIGGLIASCLIFLQTQFHFIQLQGVSFVIDYYPVKAIWTDYLAVISLVVLIAIVAGWVPAKKAAGRIFEKIG